jgi:hypothetical protein
MICTNAESMGQNLLDLGEVECHSGAVCVNTPDGPPGGYAAGDGGSCWGYCSGSCLSDSDCATGDSSRQMVCRPILLSASNCSDGGTISCGTSSMYCVFAPDAG